MGWPQTTILSISSSQVAWIMGMNHTRMYVGFKKKITLLELVIISVNLALDKIWKSLNK
jgi:hypothetical protein